MVKNIKEMIKRHEGFRDRVYKDSVGVLTIGYGHALHEGSKMPGVVLELLFDHDFSQATFEAARICKHFNVTLGANRFGVIIDMIFNLGYDRLSKFKKMWSALQQFRYHEAAAEMLDSMWATQVGSRAQELATIMATGGFQVCNRDS